jgi:hypothetical protein
VFPRVPQEAAMMTLGNWRERMSEDIRLCDFGAYFLYLRQEKKLAPSSINIAECALRFFLMRTLQPDWQVFDLRRVHAPRGRPIVLSVGEVRAVLQVEPAKWASRRPKRPR